MGDKVKLLDKTKNQGEQLDYSKITTQKSRSIEKLKTNIWPFSDQFQITSTLPRTNEKMNNRIVLKIIEEMNGGTRSRKYEFMKYQNIAIALDTLKNYLLCRQYCFIGRCWGLKIINIYNLNATQHKEPDASSKLFGNESIRRNIKWNIEDMRGLERYR